MIDMNEFTKRMLWGSWLQYYAAGVDPDEDLKPGVVEALEDCFAGMSRVLAAISKTSCFDKYYPSVSMDTIFHITATDDWQERDRFPSVHFTVFTEDRYDIRYRPGGSDGPTDKGQGLYGGWRESRIPAACIRSNRGTSGKFHWPEVSGIPPQPDSQVANSASRSVFPPENHLPPPIRRLHFPKCPRPLFPLPAALKLRPTSHTVPDDES